MKFKHDFDMNINVTIGLDSQLMQLLNLIFGDEESRVAKATAALKERTDNLANEMADAQGGREASST